MMGNRDYKPVVRPSRCYRLSHTPSIRSPARQLSDVSVLVPGIHLAEYGHVEESGPHNSCPRLIPKEWNAFRSDTIDVSLNTFTQ